MRVSRPVGRPRWRRWCAVAARWPSPPVWAEKIVGRTFLYCLLRSSPPLPHPLPLAFAFRFVAVFQPGSFHPLPRFLRSGPSSPIVPSFPRRLRRVVRRVHGRVSTVAAYGADSSPVDPLTGYGDRPDGMSLISARMESLPSSQIDSRSLPYPAQAAPTSVDPPSASIPRRTCLLCGAGSGGLQPHEPVHVRARVQDPQQRKRRSRRRRG